MIGLIRDMEWSKCKYSILQSFVHFHGEHWKKNKHSCEHIYLNKQLYIKIVMNVKIILWSMIKFFIFVWNEIVYPYVFC